LTANTFQQPKGLMMQDIFLEIARAGILAPSADNNHVFQLDFTETAIRLWPTKAFAANTDRLRHVLGLMSLGAVVENMRLRAGELGFTASVSWLSTRGTAQIVQLDLQPSLDTQADALAAAIPTRHTNRRMYHGPALNDAEVQSLNSAITSVEGIQLIWLRGEARRRALRLIWRAESERFLRKTLHEDLFSSIRFDLSWNETAEQALPPGALEIEPPMRPLFKALRHWALMRPLTWIGVHRLIGLRAGWLPAWQAPALGMLATTLPVEHGATATGQAFERLWLRATLLDIALQPLAASAVLPLQSSADQGASDELRLALTKGWQAITPGITPLMAFRMGHAAPPTIVTRRHQLESYLITTKQSL